MRRFVRLALCLFAVVVPLSSPAQTPAITAVPNLIRYSGALRDAQGGPLASSTVGVSFAIYKQQEGGAPLWMETQNVTTDSSGNYSTLLGSTTVTGLPGDLFSEQEQRWLGIQVEGQPEQARVLMVSVPYAFKAHEADTLGGKSVSDFVLANGANSAGAQRISGQSAASGATQQSGIKPLTSSGPTSFSGSTTDQIVGVTQSGTGAGVSAAAPSNAVVGMATATHGVGYGVRGMSASTNGVGVWGQNTATSGNTVGVNGAVSSPSGIAGVFNNSAGGKIISGQSRGVEKFSVDTNGNIFAAGAITTSGGLSEITAAPAGVALTGNATNINGANTGVLGETESINGLGVSGMANTSTGLNAGVYGQSNSNEGWGMYAYEGSPTGQTVGVQGIVVSSGDFSQGVIGLASNAAGQTFGVHGVTRSNTNFSAGVAGNANGASGVTHGVNGITASSTNGAAGVHGATSSTSGQIFGVAGDTASTSQYSAGVQGNATATSGQVFGVTGYTSSSTSYSAGVNGYANSTTGVVDGVSGGTGSTAQGASGVNGYEGASTGQVYGVNGGTNSTGPYAAGVSGNEGATTGIVFGVTGGTNSTSNGAAAVNGYEGATTGQVYGVIGTTASATDGADGVTGVASASTGIVAGVAGISYSSSGQGLYGQASATSGFAVGVEGSTSSSDGVAGLFTNTAAGNVLVGRSFFDVTVFSVDGNGNGYYAGNLNVTGTLTKGGGSFKIDHPLDPENKYLSHSFVESPDMMNIYNGIVRLDARGEAWVVLPDYFEALNRDYRYQLTSVGAPQPRLYIAREVKGNRFKIAGGKPNAKVSWQLTGIRQDAWANANRIPTEEDKPPQERGTYLHPELYGASADKNTDAMLRR